ncbi:MAG: NAD(P)H-dependent oxidoreductase subunit E [bacterium]
MSAAEARELVPVLPPEVVAAIEAELPHYPEKKGALMNSLHHVQRALGWIPREAMLEVAALLEIRPIEVLEVVTFYPMFREKPVGTHHLEFCRNLSCALNGARVLVRHCEKRLGIRSGETTPDGKFSIGEAECLGSCGSAPMLMSGDHYHENLTVAKLDALLDSLD